MLRRMSRPAALERCEMCGVVLAHDHAHVMEVAVRKIICACGACPLLFAGRAKYKRVPRRVRYLRDFRLSESQWDSLRMPINLAFFFHSMPQSRTVAMYPSPAGATESLLPLEIWNEIA